MERVTEGGVTVAVEEPRDGASAGTSDAVFYNPEMELNRDITVAALRAFADRRDDRPGEADGRPTYFDATAASGVRAARAAEAGYRVTAADVDSDAVALASRNLADRTGEVLHRDANSVMHERGFDVVDVDPYGSPMPFADAAVRSADGLLALTATDTAPLCGAHFASGVRRYDTVPRNTEYHPEVGLRTLLSAVVRTAARRDVAARPVCSHVSRHYARTYLAVDDSASGANDLLDGLGYVHHCSHCLARDAVHGRFGIDDVTRPETCPTCGANAVQTMGPIWLGPVADPAFTRAARDAVTDEMGEADAARDLLDRVATELDTPTHYDHHRLCEEWGRPASAMDEVIAQLREAGHEATRAHYSGTALKTTADVTEIREATSEG